MLNKEQKLATQHNKGPLLVVAGAGTGKTTVLTERIVNLINKKLASPEEILAVTFTEKAAGEMEERVDRVLPLGYSEIWIKTFHGFCQRVLEEYGMHIGLPGDFKIVDQTRGWMLVRENLERFNLDYYRPLGNPTKFIHILLNHFSRCKDEGIYPEDYLSYADSLKKDLLDDKNRIKEVADAYHTYQKLLLDNSLLDFGDLINYCVKLFEKRPKILEYYKNKFKYILVDEFQDTNYVQYSLIKLLLNKDQNLLMVADDDQAIYAWRGASFNNVIRFREDFPKSKQISLTKNYRSRQDILDLSYNFIQANNPDRLEFMDKIDKKLIAHNKGRAEIEHLHFATLEQEAQGVVGKIKELYKGDWNDFAILVRANNSALPFLRELERAEIPHQFLASRGLYSKKIILDMIAFFKLLDNYHESLALNRFLNMPIFSGYDLAKYNYIAKRKAISLYEAIGHLDIIEKYTQLAKTKKPSELLVMFVDETKLIRYLEKEDIRILNLFLDHIKEFEVESIDPSLKNFMNFLDLELESGEQGKLKFDIEQGPDMVKIMTIHSSKGLEFKHVFIVSLVDLRFPTIKRSEPIEMPEELIKEIKPTGDYHIQEERRLFYVAMTRAKQGLFLTSAQDYGGQRDKKVSRFVKDLKLPEINFKKSKKIIKTKNLKSSLPIPKSFSFSQLSTFKRCPYDYYLKYILKVPLPGSAALSYGIAMHNTLNKFLQGKQQDLFGERKIGSLDDLLKIYKENWIDDWFESKKQKQDYYKQGKKSLRMFYGSFKQESPEVLMLEKNFKISIKDYSITGRIDRIDRGEIIDYKTGNPKEKLSKDDKLQLLIYQIAAQEVLGITPERLTYYYLNNGSKVLFRGRNDDLIKAKEEILRTIKEIQKGEFPCKCGNCQYYEANKG